ncbi:MAG: C25 family cysteine peptidase, partial [Actinomycetota bacterium]|nr:C25 family cysteine peptidase [Actinomycetota bacterium]
TYTGHLVEIVSSASVRKGKGSSGGGGTKPPAGGAGGAVSQFQLAASPAVKISVSEPGLYRVSGSDLAALGLSPQSIDPRSLRLFADGTELAVSVSGEQDGRFDPADALEFFGTGVDQASTASRVYWLTAGSGAGKRIKANNAQPAAAQPVSFPSTVELDERLTYLSVVTNGERDNFFGKLLFNAPADHTLTLPSVDPAAPSASLEVALQGFSLRQHAVAVSLNGVEVGRLTFADEQNKVGTFTVPSSLLVDGANTVTLASVSGNGAISFVDHVRLTYARRSVASGDELYLPAVQRGAIKVDGFASPAVRVFDVTNRAEVAELATVTKATSGGYTAEFQPLPLANRQLYAVGAGAIKRPASLELNRASAWNARSNGADLVVVTSAGLSSALAPLVQLRQAQGYAVAVVDVEDLYDEFAFGYHTPAAIKAFVAHASRTWTKRPSALLLAGDATYDPRDYFGRGGELVPTKFVDTELNEAPSDEWLVDTTGDGVGEWTVGRLPVRTAEQLSAVVAKIVAYDEAGANRSALLVSDSDLTFAAHTDEIASTIPTGVATTTITRSSDGVTRDEVLTSLGQGPGLVHYAGHGGVLQWAGNILTNQDAAELGNERLTIFAMSNCYNGYFVEPIHSGLGESLLLSNGGAVAVWASTTATFASDQRGPSQEFTRSLFTSGMTVGEASRRAKQMASPDLRASWVLLGDPLTRMK